MPLLKLHSEQSVAAYVAKGWKLNRAYFAGDDREAYEYLMEREDHSLPRASSEEICEARRAYIIEDVFQFEDRGVVTTPGIPADSDLTVADGDMVVVIARQSAAVFQISLMIGLDLQSPYRPILLRGASKGDIETGSSIWLPYKPNSSLDKGI